MGPQRAALRPRPAGPRHRNYGQDLKLSIIQTGERPLVCDVDENACGGFPLTRHGYCQFRSAGLLFQ